ncbi:MAG: nucleotidyltransferase domain-containing protein [Chitinivibrionales bacterium]|nr:nucleotidyltransferase domain-containing protein [Chitinivibrionales bacterium]
MALFSKNQLETLALFFAHPGEEFNLSRIGESLSKKPGVFQRGINALEKSGILISRNKANQRLFSINKTYPFLSEIRSIVNKITGVEGLLRDFAEKSGPIKTALIFGSYAKDRLTPASDIDLLLVTEGKKIEDEIIAALHAVEQKIKREINYRIFLRPEFNRKIKSRDAFLGEILRDKYILLKGKI